ncbi:RING finger and WD repeat domain-containing protein 2 [Mortierella sp. NVP41]|nr:RING finger and WD repeat domain-containing protein 2 [Mortierella sp. NVP41]
MSAAESNGGSQDHSNSSSNLSNPGHEPELANTSVHDSNNPLASDTPGVSNTSSTSNSASSSPRSVVRKRQRLTSSRVISTLDGFPAGSSTSSTPAGSVDKRSILGPLLADRISSLSNDFHCPICLSLIKEVFMTRCGHSFCYSCIVHHLRDKQDCPVCRGPLTRDQIFPNFSLNNIFERSAGLLDDVDVAEPRSKSRHDILNHNDYTPEEIDNMLMTLKAKKRKMEADNKQVELEVLLDFLRNTRAEKQEESLLTVRIADRAKLRLEAQIECLDEDVRKAEKKLDSLKQYSGYQAVTRTIEEEEDESIDGMGIAGGVQVPNEVSEEEDEAVPAQAGSKRSHSQLERDSGSDDKITGRPTPEANMQMLKITKQVNINKKRVAEHFEDLQRCYFDFSLTADTRKESGLSSFCSTISKFTKFSRFEHVNTLRYGDIYNTSSIVSSIEFDRDDEYFATAGVTKKIKIFEYGCIEKSGLAGTSLRDDDPTETFEAGSELSRSSRYMANKKPITSVLHYPVREMMCRSKISCLSWNSYIKSQIASSDYEGIVSLWDAQTGVNTLNYDEHEKRAWSVDFSRTDPTRLASGSDDTKVKIWSTNHKASVCTIVSKANICCVKFNPESSNHIAFGSADHHIHYYDLRKASEPLFVFKGHRKAVSYVKFLGRDELVSASTDSTLKLWSTQRMNCVRTYTGHVNEKNFVGLSASGDWISCGSENNAVYTYYKELRDPVVTVKFGNSNPVTGEDTMDEDPSQFVSSVCWKKNTSSNILLAANSSGVIKVLELV